MILLGIVLGGGLFNFRFHVGGTPLPRSYKTHTKIWINRKLHKALQDLAKLYNASFEDVISCFYEFISNDLDHFLEFLKKKLEEKRGGN